MALVSPLRKPANYGSISAKDYRPSLKADIEAPTKGSDDSCERGLSAWLTVFGAFLALFCSFGQMNAFGTFQSWYTTHQLSDRHPSTVAWIGSVQLWVFFVSGGFIGRVFDVYGPRIIMALGTVIYVASILLTSVAQSYQEYLLAQGVLSGLGVGMLFYPPLAAISTHFCKYRATALGIAMAGSGIGGTVYPILLQYLFINVGFTWGTRISAAVCFVLCVVATATVTSRISPAAESKPTERRPWLDLHALRDPRFSSSASPGHRLLRLAVLNAASVLGRIAPAHVADAFGRFALLVPCAALAGLSTLLLWPAAHSLAGLAAYAALYGLFSGAFNALIVPCIAQISDIREIGVRIGLLYSIISFPCVAHWKPGRGALLRLTGGSYTGLIVLSGTSVVIGSFFMLLAKLRIDPNIFARV
ncbi:MFS general substrate transporter [Epithele typhae]|uniref:MFS general substrate transporter n=1 Tax=Epithele typhae TaxID=378194 RepID=UPI0020087DF2|nr:MFS general substrate transporter [Epithele typhae]KAH9916394.1 MFS general substrate transporter [Epithele typhae]